MEVETNNQYSEESIEKIKYYCKNIIANEDIINSNKKLWDTNKDRLLLQLVIMMNYNFKKIEQKFDELLGIIHKDKFEDFIYSETELRRHYSFLHSKRVLNEIVNDDYYNKIKGIIDTKQINQINKENEDEIKINEHLNKNLEINDYLESILNHKLTKEEITHNEKVFQKQTKETSDDQLLFPINITNSDE